MTALAIFTVMQDLIEELIGTEIVDETDQFVDNLRSQKVGCPKWIPTKFIHFKCTIVLSCLHATNVCFAAVLKPYTHHFDPLERHTWVQGMNLFWSLQWRILSKLHLHLQVNSATMMKGLPPRLRSLLMARQGSAISTGPSTRNINIRTINSKNSAEADGKLKRTQTDDGRKLKPQSDLKKPLLDGSRGADAGSPRSA